MATYYTSPPDGYAPPTVVQKYAKYAVDVHHRKILQAIKNQYLNVIMQMMKHHKHNKLGSNNGIFLLKNYRTSDKVKKPSNGGNTILIGLFFTVKNSKVVGAILLSSVG